MRGGEKLQLYGIRAMQKGSYLEERGSGCVVLVVPGRRRPDST
jgi:hypothetical protein